ncbi:flagellar motor protein MotA [Pyruvatibacter sp.]|uniref:flagellar motor protein MotA n=1 Tax=Pyruvatibacter sp. TaxID=1981328 RepID=UPI0032EC60E8
MARAATTDTLSLTQPSRHISRMLTFLVIVGLVLVVLWPQLAQAFFANVVLNGLIAGVLLLGVLYTFRQVLVLGPEIRWVNAFRRADPGLTLPPPPRLLAPMATLLGERKGRVAISPPAMRSILDSIASRLDEARDISRYMIGLLIFLGLLGTFWGLLETVSSIADTIRTLSPAGGTGEDVFEDLRTGLEAPLTGMGTAFSSSLLGLGGSLIVGFLDLQASQAQNRFYNELEEWLSTVTRLDASADTDNPLLSELAKRLDDLRRDMGGSSGERSATTASLMALTERLTILSDQIRAESQLLNQVASNQADLKPVLEQIAKLAARDRS